MAKTKFAQRTSSVADAISNGFSDLTSLAEEVREVVDNSESFSATERIQTLDSTASDLEGLDEPTDVPACLEDAVATYTETLPRRARRGLSRADRRDNAVAALRGAEEACDAWLTANEPEEGEESQELEGQRSDVEALRDALSEACDTAEGCDFSGQRG